LNELDLTIYILLFSPFLRLFRNVLFGLGGHVSELYASLAAFRVPAMLYYYVLSFLDKQIDSKGVARVLLWTDKNGSWN